jgi:hypothetical protein
MGKASEQCSCFPVRFCFAAGADTVSTGISVGPPACSSFLVAFTALDGTFGVLSKTILAVQHWDTTKIERTPVSGMVSDGLPRFRAAPLLCKYYLLRPVRIGLGHGNACPRGWRWRGRIALSKRRPGPGCACASCVSQLRSAERCPRGTRLFRHLQQTETETMNQHAGSVEGRGGDQETTRGAARNKSVQQ